MVEIQNLTKIYLLSKNHILLVFFIFSFFCFESSFHSNINEKMNKNYIQSRKLSSLRKKLKEKYKVVFLGDSIVANWYKLDPKFFKENSIDLEIMKDGTTKDAVKFLRRRIFLSCIRPRIVFVLLGVYDIAGIERKFIEFNTLVNAFQLAIEGRLKSIKMVFCSLLPVNNIPKCKKPIKEVNRRIKIFNRDIYGLCKFKHYRYVDLFSLLEDKNGHLDKTLTKDGINLNLKGYKKLELAIWKTIRILS